MEDRPEGAPLLVALHGCTQTARDFAAGTRFDLIAEREGFFVLYPEQSLSANSQRCWNWFLPEHQRRDGGEPAAVLALVRAACTRHRIDPQRIFVAGLSAGGALAAILAEQAPDVFAAVGIMAGVQMHASHDAASAYHAMHGDVLAADIVPVLARRHAPIPGFERLRATIWTGDADHTVAPSNADTLARQFLALLGLDAMPDVDREARARVARWRDAQGTVRVEAWHVPTMGHAWSGGSYRGSHTFPEGPDASEEMVAFFLGRCGTARREAARTSR